MRNGLCRQAPEEPRGLHGGRSILRYSHPSESSGPSDADRDLRNPKYRPLGKVVAEKGFTTDTNGVAALSFKLAAGAYRVVLEAGPLRQAGQGKLRFRGSAGGR